jgi:site-specific recombinase XerD
MPTVHSPIACSSNERVAALSLVTERAHEYADQAKASNTLRAYRADWRDFAAWCAAADRPALPATPETVALYLADLAGAGRKASTLQRRLSAISRAHQYAGHPSPTKDAAVRAVWAGIRRAHGVAQDGKAPALTADIRAMVNVLPPGLIGVRDRALLLLGFAGAFRRSELVALDVADLELTREGIVVTLRRSKTDQEGEGRRLGIPAGQHAATCPVQAIRAWTAIAGIVEGPLFRPIDRHGNMGPGRLSDRAVALAVKRAALAAGLDPDRYAGHSLRAALATSAAAAGASERSIMDQTGHRSLTMVRRYIREGSLFRDNAAARRTLGRTRPQRCRAQAREQECETCASR